MADQVINVKSAIMYFRTKSEREAIKSSFSNIVLIEKHTNNLGKN